MESATILTPLAPALAVFFFPSEPYIPEGPEYEKNINAISFPEVLTSFQRLIYTQKTIEGY